MEQFKIMCTAYQNLAKAFRSETILSADFERILVEYENLPISLLFKTNKNNGCIDENSYFH